ncbi:MAG: hypothetical protein H6Q80_1876 [Deltaproteobacteria bacterium]|jgi:hypothetical protein|nr:hypothetical protein [Deltaproteobacteria bacterium]
MPKRDGIRKGLIIDSRPIIIGPACGFDVDAIQRGEGRQEFQDTMARRGT